MPGFYVANYLRNLPLTDLPLAGYVEDSFDCPELHTRMNGFAPSPHNGYSIGISMLICPQLGTESSISGSFLLGARCTVCIVFQRVLSV